MAGSGLTLVIGDKNFSSWSLRPWLLLKMFDIPFREERIRLRQPDTRARILAQSPSGWVPILKDGDLTIWDTLAIAMHLVERFPTLALWPASPEPRAVAQSITAEMHSGFGALRTVCSMNILGRMQGFMPVTDVKGDIARIDALWQDARARFGKGGDFLFGTFTIADAFYAPVVTRFRTYGVKVSKVSQAYCNAILTTDGMREWERGAREEMSASGGD